MTGQIKPMTCKEALDPNERSVEQPESQWTHYKCLTHFVQILCESVVNRRCKWKKSHSYLPCITVIALGGFSFCKQSSFGKSP